MSTHSSNAYQGFGLHFHIQIVLGAHCEQHVQIFRSQFIMEVEVDVLRRLFLRVAIVVLGDIVFGGKCLSEKQTK